MNEDVYHVIVDGQTYYKTYSHADALKTAQRLKNKRPTASVSVVKRDS
jgi:hypothetical protein